MQSRTRTGPEPAALTPPAEAARASAAPPPAAAHGSALRNAFTVDVEEWFHILGAGCALPMERWASMESRVEEPTRHLLDMLDAAGVKGTFFILGWAAEHHRTLVREIADRGHEVASHGYAHSLIYDQSPREFRRDVGDSKRCIEDITGQRVLGYRAPGFSIRRDTTWALDVLLDEGFVYDSSVMPASHGHGGLTGVDDAPQLLRTPAGDRIAEFPLSTYHAVGRSVPYSGGGYLRLFPIAFIEHAMRVANAPATGAARPVTIYIHPREVDPDQPRLPGLPLHRRFKYYVGLATAERKLRRLLDDFAFVPLRELYGTYFAAGTS